MIWKKTLKYPVLVVGVILFALFLSDPKTAEWWEKSQRRFIPSTCDAVKDRVAPKAPESWSLSCPTIHLLVVNIEHNTADSGLLVLRPQMYKHLANSLSALAKYSNIETLEFLKSVEIIIEHPRLSIRSKTDGEAVAQILKLKSQQEIAQHLKLTVKVKELVKD